jgi:hypothetical protein
MQFSETIAAALIGAMATVATALFQLFNALRARGGADYKPRRGSTLRSVLSVVMLMLASGAGGYLYSELRQEKEAKDIRAVSDKLNEQSQLLAALKDKLDQPGPERSAAAVSSADIVAVPAMPVVPSAAVIAPVNDLEAESIVYSPGCQQLTCDEATAADQTLCAAVPEAMSIHTVQLFAKTVVSTDAIPAADAVAAWQSHEANFDQDVGGAKFTGALQTHSEGNDHKLVCVAFMHWSHEAHVARLLVHYGPRTTATSQTVNAAL